MDEKKQLEKSLECPQGSKKWEVLSALSCSIMMLMIGSTLGWNSPSLMILQDGNRTEVPLRAHEASTLAGAVAIGQSVGPIINYVMIDRIGRKNTILVGSLPLALGSVMIAIQDNYYPLLCIARFLSGLMVGIGFCVTAIYAGEVASTNFRGVANVFLTLMLNLGVLLSYVIGGHFEIWEVAIINLVITMSFIGLFSFMPESPYYLMMIDKSEEADAVLRKLRGRIDVQQERESIEDTLRSTQTSQDEIAIKKLFGDRACLRGILIVALLSVVLYFGGFLPIVNHCKKIASAMKIHSIDPNQASMMAAVVQTMAGASTSLFVDKLGRKPLLAISGFVTGLGNLVIAIYFLLQDYQMPENISDYSLIPFTSLLMVVFAFNCGVVVVQSIFISEFFSPDLKALAVCIVTLNGGVLNFISAKLYLDVAETMQMGHAWPFMVFVVVCWAVTYWTLILSPETRGKTLLEIQEEFQGGRKFREKNLVKMGSQNGCCIDDGKLKMLS